jgi:hypothetical protein
MAVRIEGLEAIREFLDPYMSRSYFYRHIRPELDSILLKRRRRPNSSVPRYYTFEPLLIAWMIRKKII